MLFFFFFYISVDIFVYLTITIHNFGGVLGHHLLSNYNFILDKNFYTDCGQKKDHCIFSTKPKLSS